MSRTDEDPFYIGYVPVAPAPVARAVRVIAACLAGAALAAAAVLAVTQNRADPGVFEFGRPRTVHGLLVEHPYPSLLVPGEGPDGLLRYLLVAEGKHGAQDLTRGLGGSWVAIRGTRIARPDREMLEVVAGGVAPADAPAVTPGAPPVRHLGRQTFEGEIVDSKCWLGVMKPATGNVHRGCAARCLSGGVPPLLVVRRPDGAVDHILLAAATGGPAGDHYAGMVGRPVRVTGELYAEGDLRVLWVMQLAED